MSRLRLAISGSVSYRSCHPSFSHPMPVVSTDRIQRSACRFMRASFHARDITVCRVFANWPASRLRACPALSETSTSMSGSRAYRNATRMSM